MAIDGTLTTGGPTCDVGCDFVFDPSYDLESIEEHAAQMWANSHLPAVGPTQKGTPFNLTEKTGGMLNELEKAHIFIEQLNERLNKKGEALEELRTQNELLRARLAAVEAALQER